MSGKHKIVIAGAGGIGRAVGLMIRELGDFEADIYMGDAEEARAAEATHWVADGLSSLLGRIEAFKMPREGSSTDFDAILEGADILLDCLPGEQAPRMARLAHRFNTHYANMTEYLKKTDEIIKIADGAEKGFVLQTGDSDP